jgi:hypothetical protein
MLRTVCQAQNRGEQVHAQGLLTAYATTRGSAGLQPLYPLPKARRPDVPAGCTTAAQVLAEKSRAQQSSGPHLAEGHAAYS